MTPFETLMARHDRIGRLIDAVFPPDIHSDEDYQGYCETVWTAKRDAFARDGISMELSVDGKRWLYEQLGASLARAAGGSLAGLHLGEVGAGSGVGALLAGAEAASVSLVDRSRAALQYGRMLAEGLGLGGRVRLVRADVLRDDVPELPHASLDLVFSSGVIEHFPYPDAVELLRRKRRMVRPGGIVVAFVPMLLSPCMIWRMSATRSKGSERFISQSLLRAMFDAAGLPGSRPARLASPLPATASRRLCDAMAVLTRPFPWLDMLFGRYAVVS